MTKRLDAPSAAVRIRVMKRDKFRCTYCGAPGTDAELEVDHIIAVAKGGSHHISNLTTACRACNQAKGAGPAKPSAAPSPGLTGMWLHTFKSGRIDRQGCVVGIDGDIALVQLFSWFDGAPTIVVPISKAMVYSSECRLYATADLMNAAAEKEPA
jgi:5-methylcytosine-specific restriction enzyme A